MLIRYGGLVANYHHGFTPNSRLVIWLSGMPGLPAITSDSDVIHFLATGYNVVFPEYYGFGRSDGDFTPDNCLQTVIDTYDFFAQGGSVTDVWTQEVYEFSSYQEVVVIGSSFGAAFASRVAQVVPQIQRVGLFSGAIQYADMNQIGFPEESTDDVMRVLKQGGFGYMYRSAVGGDRDLFYQDQWGQSYSEVVQDLSQKDVFIVHGDADDCVYVGRSRMLYQQLQDINASGKYIYLEIPTGGHGGITKQIGVVEFCKWLIESR